MGRRICGPFFSADDRGLHTRSQTEASEVVSKEPYVRDDRPANDSSPPASIISVALHLQVSSDVAARSADAWPI
jgi:hypothetical protein